MIAFAYSGGLRAAELCGLEVADVLGVKPTPSGDVVMVHVRPEIAKRGRERHVALGLDVLPYLEAWQATRDRLGIRSPVLFCTISKPSPGGKLDTSYMRRRLPALARRAGISRRVHMHALRATMATEMVHESVPLSTLQAQLGHSSLLTTFLYVKKLAPELALAPIATRPGWREDSLDTGSA
jgi:integrase